MEAHRSTTAPKPFERGLTRKLGQPPTVLGSWADLALECGYYDPAHLVREVRRFTGLTPTEARPLAQDLYSQLC